MEKFIEKIYNNKLFDCTKVLIGEKTKELESINIAANKAIFNSLSEEQKSLFNNYINSTNLFFDDQLYLTFEQGFIIGARLALEVAGFKKADLILDKLFEDN